MAGLTDGKKRLYEYDDPLESDDLFEHIRRKIGCTYISDMRFGKNKNLACIAMTMIDLSGYSIEALEDMAEYLFVRKPAFDTRKQAYEYFEEGCGKG